jgi:hypothetical protein
MTLNEAGKVASGAIEALKGSPGLLVLVLLQLVTLGVLAWVADHNSARRQERELLLLRSCIAHIADDTRH